MSFRILLVRQYISICISVSIVVQLELVLFLPPEVIRFVTVQALFAKPVSGNLYLCYCFCIIIFAFLNHVCSPAGPVVPFYERIFSLVLAGPILVRGSLCAGSLHKAHPQGPCAPSLCRLLEEHNL